MAVYRVLYKTDADTDGRSYPLGPFPDADAALSHFNSTYVSKESIGPFTFVETSASIPDYSLVEREPPNGAETLYALYKA